ncbi:MAG: transcriptional repressor [Candidatus Levybacteria bacterium]|nr:transcriptional repressor [Candidatus Levybacteria bacterium]
MNSSIAHDCRQELRSVDLKITPARLAILWLLENTDEPVDVATIIDDLDKKDIKADPATVFRIINLFTDKGLTRQIQLREGKFRYEKSGEEHHHLICERCGNIQDISDCGINTLEKEIQSKKGFLVKYHSLEFFGVCQSCQH